jgi:fructose-1,6-bisphosphatase II
MQMLCKELTLDLVRVTEAAALGSGRWVGKGCKNEADAAAVRGMRTAFDTVPIRGTVVIGEGEMDEAPMLYIGEKVGCGSEKDPEVDIAVDPLEGTNLCAKDAPSAIAVFAAAEKGNLLYAPDMYMDKICVGPAGKGLIDINASVTENVTAYAKASGKQLGDVNVVVLDRERHRGIIKELRSCGCRVQLITDGDVAPAVACGLPDTGIDMVIGIGGAPEGVIAAAALKCLGGDMQGKLWPEDDDDRERMAKMGIHDDNKVLTMEELAHGNDVFFTATGITTGPLLPGITYDDGRAVTYSIVLRSLTGTVRYIKTIHDYTKKPMIDKIDIDKP